MLEMELHAELEHKQEHSKKRLEEQNRRANGEAQLKNTEIERLTARLKDLQDDLRQKDALERKLGEEHRQILGVLKH